LRPTVSGEITAGKPNPVSSTTRQPIEEYDAATSSCDEAAEFTIEA
jgi:hypothetical protein